MLKLSDIAFIKTGYNVKRGIELTHSKQTPYIAVIQPKDIRCNIDIDIASLDKFPLKTNKTDSFVKKEDILLTNKGSMDSFIVKENTKVLASSSFYIIRITNKNFLPEYICMLLKSNYGRSKLTSRQNTLQIKTITKFELETIEIPQISLAKQQKLALLYELFEKEVEIMEKLKENRKRMIDSIIIKEIKEHING